MLDKWHGWLNNNACTIGKFKSIIEHKNLDFKDDRQTLTRKLSKVFRRHYIYSMQ